MPNLEGLGACPPENFEKLYPLRVNLRAFLMALSYPVLFNNTIACIQIMTSYIHAILSCDWH